MEPLIADAPEKVKAQFPLERVSLTREEAEKLGAWLTQLNESSKGFLTLSKADLVNFLIAEHKAELSTKEIQQIRARHYDPIRHMNWIMQELKAAIGKGDMAAVAALQNEIKGVELSVIAKATDTHANILNENQLGAAPKQRKKRTAKKETPASENNSDHQ